MMPMNYVWFDGERVHVSHENPGVPSVRVMPTFEPLSPVKELQAQVQWLVSEVQRLKSGEPG